MCKARLDKGAPYTTYEAAALSSSTGGGVAAAAPPAAAIAIFGGLNCASTRVRSGAE